jgi:diacylglycerol kinase (ATP)
VGGDGTVHETAKRLIGRGPALGILPIGSGNGFARHIGLPVDPTAALSSCKGGRIETIDTALVNDHPFLGVMGIGFDAMIADRFAASTVRGLETYIRLGLQAFADFKAEEYEVTANGSTSTKRAFVIAVANSGQYGNNARIAPLASMQDGILDVTLIEHAPFFRLPMIAAQLFAGNLHRARGVTTLRGRNITVRRESAGAAHLDGEPVTLPAFVSIDIVPRSLRVIVPDVVRAI